MRKSNYSSDEINFIKTNYSDHGAKFCSTELNRPYNSVRYKAKQLGLNVSKSALSFLMKNRPQKTLDMYRVNPLQFMKLTSPISINILGLLWADGGISFNEKVGAIDFLPPIPTEITLFQFLIKRGRGETIDMVIPPTQLGKTPVKLKQPTNHWLNFCKIMIIPLNQMSAQIKSYP